MTKREKFIELVELLMKREKFNFDDEEWADAQDYWNALNAGEDTDKSAFTENGLKVLKYVKENKDLYNNLFKAKEIGEGLCLSSRTVSGAMRKLVTDGYLEKVGDKPVIYSLTAKGIEVALESEDK